MRFAAIIVILNAGVNGFRRIIMKKTIVDSDRATYSIAEAARRLGISRASAYRAAHAGELPAIKIGGRFLVLRKRLDRMLAGDGASASVAGPEA